MERKCHICGSTATEWCEKCVKVFHTRPDARGMSLPDKLKELQSLFGPLEIPFSLVHQRLEELMGRPVWTHELGRPEALTAELESQHKATFDDVLAKLLAEKMIVCVSGEE